METENLFDFSVGYSYLGRTIGLTSCKLFVNADEVIYLTKSSLLYTRLAHYNNNDTRITASSWVTEGYAAIQIPTLENYSYSIVEFKNVNGTNITQTEAKTISEVVVSRSTPPDHYIPYGYKLPLTVESGEQTQELSVYIGDSKLSETEYVDSESGKIYKLQEGVLSPTDPPVSFPAITVSGETTITTTETLGDVEFTGDWTAIMGSTEQTELEIGLTVDADSYIAMLTIDNDPTIQVFDTFTMPSSAGSFTLQVVSWGREQYTDTVYNALT